MPRYGMTDKPDANQAEIVDGLRALGYKVFITKRPVDLWVIEPSGRFAAWVEVKRDHSAKFTKAEDDFFVECPPLHRIRAITVDDVLGHFERIARAYAPATPRYDAAFVTKEGHA